MIQIINYLFIVMECDCIGFVSRLTFNYMRIISNNIRIMRAICQWNGTFIRELQTITTTKKKSVVCADGVRIVRLIWIKLEKNYPRNMSGHDHLHSNFSRTVVFNVLYMCELYPFSPPFFFLEKVRSVPKSSCITMQILSSNC